MLKLRKSKERGFFDFGWLKTHHTFSFSEYYDPQYMHFRNLRVMNEDFIGAGEGFETHSHKNMEIISYMMGGSLEHKDSMGNGSVIPAGDIQYMSAGSGVQHSEFNHSKTELAHLIQIWILPDEKETEPRYDQRKIKEEEKKGKLKLLASKDGDQNSIAIRQDVRLYAAILDENETLNYSFSKRYGWIQCLRGKLNITNSTNEVELLAGDGLAISEENILKISSQSKNSEFLLFNLN